MVALTERTPLEVTARPAKPAVKYAALNPDYPRAWWTIGWSGDVKGNRVLPLRILERDMVLWRDSGGELHCQAGHCPHLGVHIGYGGEVVGDTVRCPFHGWQYDGAGKLAAQPGHDRLRENVCLPTYRVVERYGAVFLWNGAGEPDFDFPDILAEAGFAEEDVVFAHHRWFLPFPAKWFGENLCDGMHFAVAHDTAEWGETIIDTESPTVMRMTNAIYDRHRWLGWKNVKKRFQRGELQNLLTPVTNDILSTCWGGSLHLVRFADRPNILGNIIACWTPIDSHSHYVLDLTLLPKVRVPVVGPMVEKAVGFAAGLGNWSTAIQDAGLMMHRAEQPNPAYHVRDRGLVTFRRFWDSRIVSDGPLAGDNLRSNGARAGIRVKKDDGNAT
jgi:nitrite reductase/ring-hydroxylating ferredoxin subunit